MKYFFLISIYILSLWNIRGQNLQTDSIIHYQDAKMYYEDAFVELENMIKGNDTFDLKKAVFIVEDAYYEKTLNHQAYISFIERSINTIKAFKNANPSNYDGEDYENVALNSAIYIFMMDTVWLDNNQPLHTLFSYRFEDIAGVSDWSNMFIITLMDTGKGNCHSLSFLYKILAEEMGAEAYLSLAPSHMYIKCRSEKTNWYNTELSNGMFPVDAWVSASGYVSMDAIRSGIYMDTLGIKQTLAVCLYDLAKGFQKKFGFAHYKFILKCLDLALEYYPNYISALLLKSETLKQRFDIYLTLYKPDNYKDILHLDTPKEIYDEIESITAQILDLGYREMPEEMYREWLFSNQNNMEKYQNRKIHFYLKK